MAYALISLVNIVEQYQHHLVLDSRCKSQIKSLLKEASLLKELFFIRSSEGLECMESPIREAVHKAEDVIEFYILDQTFSSDSKDGGDSQLNLSGVIAEIEHIKHQISDISGTPSEIQVNIIGETVHDINHLARVARARWLRPAEVLLILKNYEVHQLTTQVPYKPPSGSLYLFDKHELKQFHIDGHSWRRNKDGITVAEAHEWLKVGNVFLRYYCAHGQDHTFFQRRTYSMLHPPLFNRIFLVHYLDIKERPQNSKPESLFSPLSNSISSPGPDSFAATQSVSSRVTDGSYDQDKLEVAVEDNINLPQKQKFAIEDIPPDYTKGAKAQTKNTNSYIASSSQYLSKNDDASWKLLRSKVFGEEDSFYSELEVLGKKIAKACMDLPLAINLIAAFLSSSKYEQKLWKLVESKVSTIGTAGGIYFNILSVIYDHLPFHLKACFLYIGVFPQAVEIKSSRIIKLWIAEGYVESTECSLEETAELYLESLIDKNLLSVSRKELDGKAKAFEVDFHVNKFCQEKAREENFLLFKDSREHSILEDEERRVSLHPLSEPVNATTSKSLARSFLCIGCASVRIALSFHRMRLLRVLDVFQLEFHRFPKEILQLVLLRYLAFSCHSDLPSAISRFLNLQTLIIRRLPSSRAFTLPPGLWELTELRHVISKETCVWYYPRDEEDLLQENLQTLSNIHVFLLTNKVIGRIPNLTKLGIFCDSSLQAIIGLDCLQKLETLKCTASWSCITRDFLFHLKFPPSLKKLTLSSCKIPWGFMMTVCSLPNLEHLKLQNCDFLSMGLESESEPIEPAWVPVEGGFLLLRSLLMKELNLVHWRAHASHFPSLQRLVIRDCCSMTKIPLAIGDIETLELIEVDEASPSVLASANQIKVARLGREFPELRICKS